MTMVTYLAKVNIEGTKRLVVIKLYKHKVMYINYNKGLSVVVM